jgi:hypothetical protein
VSAGSTAAAAALTVTLGLAAYWCSARSCLRPEPWSMCRTHS